MRTPRGRSGRDSLSLVPGTAPSDSPSDIAGVPGTGVAVSRSSQPQTRQEPGRGSRRDAMQGDRPGSGQLGRLKVAGRPTIDLDELWAPVRPRRVSQDREFLPGALEILEAPASPIRVMLIYALCGLVATALAWSWFGHLDVYADATGKVQASGRTKVVQPVSSGRVTKIMASDGDGVKGGDVLVQLDR